jgi:hypothetical protein
MKKVFAFLLFGVLACFADSTFVYQETLDSIKTIIVPRTPQRPFWRINLPGGVKKGDTLWVSMKIGAQTNPSPIYRIRYIPKFDVSDTANYYIDALMKLEVSEQHK